MAALDASIHAITLPRHHVAMVPRRMAWIARSSRAMTKREPEAILFL
jgi:hypothetical protein